MKVWGKKSWESISISYRVFLVRNIVINFAENEGGNTLILKWSPLLAKKWLKCEKIATSDEDCPVVIKILIVHSNIAPGVNIGCMVEYPRPILRTVLFLSFPELSFSYYIILYERLKVEFQKKS